MTDVRVEFQGRTVVVEEGDALSFGRTSTEPGIRAGWGSRDRFLEIGPQDFVHRNWGRLRADRGVCFVTSLGSAWPITVYLPSGEATRLRPWTDAARAIGSVPDELAVTQETFTVELRAGTAQWDLHCRLCGTSDPVELLDPQLGRPTRGLGDMVTDAITRTEFNVLWAMSTEFRDAAGSPDEATRAPRPLSYTRIQRLLGLESTRQATAATERLVKRFREGLLLAADTEPDAQRAAICAIAVDLGMIDDLSAKYGTPDATRSPPSVRS